MCGGVASVVVFFFKQKTAYEIPKRDWSSDVCSSDLIWWDHHDWSATMRVPAVVGSFPEPFSSGIGGRRLPVRIVCLQAEAACDEVETRLHDAGIDDTARSVL